MKVGRFILAGLIIIAFSMPVLADEVVINTAQTLGCFASVSCTPASGSATWNPSGSDNTVTFTGFDTGNQTTSGGALNVKLGTFTWGGSAYNIGNTEEFFGTVVFTLPSGINGGQSDTFHADITGHVEYFGDDTLKFDFSNTPILLTFANGNVSGSFYFYVDDVNMTQEWCGDSVVDWNGHVTRASQTDPVPEPASMMLLASGLAGMAGAIRRKLKQ